MDSQGAGDTIGQVNKSLGGKQVAFDAEVAAIKEVIRWFELRRRDLPSLIVHFDSTSVIARAGHAGAGPFLLLATSPRCLARLSLDTFLRSSVSLSPPALEIRQSQDSLISVSSLIGLLTTAITPWTEIFQRSPFSGIRDLPILIVHSDSTSAIARAGHTGAGPGQSQALVIHRMEGDRSKSSARCIV
jgi:hypothetical protein